MSRRRPMTLRDLGAIACLVADRMRDRNRRQKTFLGVNDIGAQADLFPVAVAEPRPHTSPLLAGGLLAPRCNGAENVPATQRALRPR